MSVDTVTETGYEGGDLRCLCVHRLKQDVKEAPSDACANAT